MKKIQYQIVFSCFCLFMMSLGCEKADLQKSTANKAMQIEQRGECEECPGFTECCCFVELEDGDDDAYVIFCGTSDGPDNCTGAPSCGEASFSGLGETFDLESTGVSRYLFCMYENGGMWIYNYHASDVANIIISCQAELTNPDTVHLHIKPLHKVYYRTNGSCELDPC